MKYKIDLTKALVALAAIGAAVALGGDGAMPLVTLIVGYVLGNSRSVRGGDYPGNLIEPNDQRPNG